MQGKALVEKKTPLMSAQQANRISDRITDIVNQELSAGIGVLTILTALADAIWIFLRTAPLKDNPSPLMEFKKATGRLMKDLVDLGVVIDSRPEDWKADKDRILALLDSIE